MTTDQSRPLTLGQYVLLSIMAFRGPGARYPSDELIRDRRLVLGWMSDQTDPEDGPSHELSAVLSGSRYVGVEHGRVVTRPSDEPLLPYELRAIRR
jgi:hypothetical protein